MKKYDVITIGGSTEDFYFTVDDYNVINNQADPLKNKLIAFEYGSKVGIKNISASFGGGAANTALAFTKLGFKTAVLTAIGEDEEGASIMDNFKKHKVDCRFVKIEAGARSGQSLVLKTISNDHVLFTYRGANDKLTISRSLEKKIAKAKRLYLASLTGDWKKIINSVVNSEVKLAWNPGRKQLAAGYSVLKQFLAKTEILVLNKDEATELVISATKNKTIVPLNIILRKLRSFGPKIVVVTEDVKGAVAFDGKKMYRQPAIKTKAADTTGVGDAFAATFVAALDHGLNITKALKLAAKNSASVVAKPGAQHGLLSKAQLGL